MKTRKGVAYRNLERPYTRVSKYRKKNYTRGNPQSNIVHFDMGNRKKKFSTQVSLFAENGVQIRSIALESARQTCNRRLEKTVGKENFYFKIMLYPHHIMRENPLASGAGADRMSTGMKHSFGKPIGRSALVKKGKELFRLSLDEKHTKFGRQALRLASHKLPTSCKIRVVS